MGSHIWENFPQKDVFLETFPYTKLRHSMPDTDAPNETLALGVGHMMFKVFKVFNNKKRDYKTGYLVVWYFGIRGEGGEFCPLTGFFQRICLKCTEGPTK